MVRILTILVVVGLIVNGLTLLILANYIDTQEKKAGVALLASPPRAPEPAVKQPVNQPVNPEVLRKLTSIETSLSALTRKVDGLASRPAASVETPIASPVAPRSPVRGAITGDRRRPASAQPVSNTQPVDGDVPIEHEATPEPAPEGTPETPGQPAPATPPPVPADGETPPPQDNGAGPGTPPEAPAGTPPGASQGAGGGG